MANIQNVSAMTKRKLGEETPSTEPSVLSPSPLFSPGLTERQQIALAMKLSGESSQGDNFTTPRPSKVCVSVYIFRTFSRITCKGISVISAPRVTW